MWLKVIKGSPDPISVENLLYIGKATKKKLDLVQTPSFSSKVQMIPVTKCLVYRKLSLNVPDASGEVYTVKPSDTHLAVDHMAQGYSQPHPQTLNVIEV